MYSSTVGNQPWRLYQAMCSSSALFEREMSDTVFAL